MCPRCQKTKAVSTQPTELYSTRARAPFMSVFADYIGPLRSSDGFRHILVVLDRFSHFLQLTATKDTTAETTAAIFLNDWLCSFGVPATITTDGGTSFTGKAFTDVLQRYRIKHHVSAPHHPQGHGAVERANQTVEQIIRALLKDKATWLQLVKPAAFAINTAY